MKTLSCDKCGQIVEDKTGKCKEVVIRDNQSEYNNMSPVAGELFHLCHDCYKQILQQWSNNEYLKEQ